MIKIKIAWLFSKWAFFKIFGIFEDQDFWHFFKIFGILRSRFFAFLRFFNFSKIF